MTVYGNYDVIAFRSCIQIFTVYIWTLKIYCFDSWKCGFWTDRLHGPFLNRPEFYVYKRGSSFFVKRKDKISILYSELDSCAIISSFHILSSWTFCQLFSYQLKPSFEPALLFCRRRIDAKTEYLGKKYFCSSSSYIACMLIILSLIIKSRILMGQQQPSVVLSVERIVVGEP